MLDALLRDGRPQHVAQQRFAALGVERPRPGRGVQLFDKHFVAHDLTRELASTVTSGEFKSWSDARAILAHRVDSGRVIVVGGASRWTSLGIELGEHALVPRREWLAARVAAVLAGADAFVADHL